MKKIIVFITVFLLFAAPLGSLAEPRAINKEEAQALMDRMKEMYTDGSLYRTVENENAQHTREWERDYGRSTRWDGDVMAEYVLTYGMMPTHNAPYANPLAVYPVHARLSIEEAKQIAKEAAMSVDSRLTESRLENMRCIWEFDYCRDLDWFWTEDGTWIITWYNGDEIVCRTYLRDTNGTPTVVFIYLDCHDPYTDDGLAVYTDF